MSKLKEQFSNLFDFFKIDENSKSEDFQDMLDEILKFSDVMKDKAANGSEEEKKEVQEFLNEMQEKMEEEKSKMIEKIGLSEKELLEFLKNKENFSEEEWKVMQEMQNQMEEVSAKDQEVKKIKKQKSKLNWIQS